jgi:hypothetical protein
MVYMANTPKKKIIDDATKIGADFLQPIFGGDSSADPTSPDFAGHFHDDGNTWGHAPKINLSQHTTDRLILQDSYAVAKSVSAYPSIVVAANNILSATFLNVNNSSLKSAANLNGVLPLQKLDGYFNALINTYPYTNLTTPPQPFTSPNILASAIWYFSLPLDMDITKQAFFSFYWMGDIVTTDGYGNNILDSTKLTQLGQPAAQTTIFRVTWQWFSPGYAVFPPAIIYDGYTPANIIGSNINQNSLTRGRIPSLTVNELPFRMIVNDSSSNNPNYVNLSGLSQTTNANMLGVQIDILSSGFVNTTPGSLSGHLSFFQGNMIYLSKTMGSAITSFRVF